MDRVDTINFCRGFYSSSLQGGKTRWRLLASSRQLLRYGATIIETDFAQLIESSCKTHIDSAVPAPTVLASVSVQD